LGIDDNIRSGYMFLAQNYIEGDEIYLFGFSRGAFTARSLVGLISSAGLLTRQSLGQLGYAWEYYRTPKAERPGKTFVESRNGAAEVYEKADITFLGVWDTVGALGIPGKLFQHFNERKNAFYDTGLCPIVRVARHAMAIDEHRGAFVPTFWTGEIPAGCDVKQVWFTGAHADVGGGYLDRDLADIPLVWMAREAEKAGLVLDWEKCLPHRDGGDALAPRHNSSSGMFTYNQLIPTLRRVCEQDVHVSRLETLYAPVDSDGKPVRTINESIHSSVLSRFAQADVFGHLGDAPVPEVKADQRWDSYRPENLLPMFAKDGQVSSAIPIEA
jgi:hypothetical protein